jgi:hypothetical protein
VFGQRGAGADEVHGRHRQPEQCADPKPEPRAFDVDVVIEHAAAAQRGDPALHRGVRYPGSGGELVERGTAIAAPKGEDPVVDVIGGNRFRRVCWKNGGRPQLSDLLG